MNLYTDGTTLATRSECEAAIVAIDASAEEAAKRTASKDLVQSVIDADDKLSGFTAEEVAEGVDTTKVVVVFPTDTQTPKFFAAAAAEIVDAHGGTFDNDNPYRVEQYAVAWVGRATAWQEDNHEIVTERSGGHLKRIVTAL
jgi:hypothetical protein